MYLMQLLTTLLLSSQVYSRCYDSSRSRNMETGYTYYKMKRMHNSQLQGRYRCVCRSDSRIYCTAVDIPCMDDKYKRFVAKGQKVNILNRREGDYMKCTCMGGPGRYENCKLGGCRDILTRALVPYGEYYVTKSRNLRRYLTCLCQPPPTQGACKLYTGKSSSTGHMPHPTRTPRFTITPRSVPHYTRYRPVTTTTETPEENTRNPCSDIVNTCHYRARCSVQENTASCVCIRGFTGNGNTCTDLDECTSGDNVCHENANCANTIGSYRCSCTEGFIGNGYACQEMCRDEVTGAYVPDSDTFLKIVEGRQMMCTCQNGEAVEGSCIHHQVPGIIEETSTQESSTVSSTIRTTRASIGDQEKQSSAQCFNRNEGKYYNEGDTYIWNRRSRSYSCKCTRRGDQMVSTCQVYSRNPNN